MGPPDQCPELQEQIETFIIQWDPRWTFEPEDPSVDLTVESVRTEVSEGGLIVRGSVVPDSVDQIHIIVGVRELSSGLIRGVGTQLLDEIGEIEFDVFIPLEPGVDLSSLEPIVIAKGMRDAGP